MTIYIHIYTHTHTTHTHILSIVNNAAMNIWTLGCIFSNLCFYLLLDIYPRVELLEHMVVLFLVSWDLHAVFHSSYNNLHSYQQWTRLPFSPHPCQHFLYFSVLVSSPLGKWTLFYVEAIQDKTCHCFITAQTD